MARINKTNQGVIKMSKITHDEAREALDFMKDNYFIKDDDDELKRQHDYITQQEKLELEYKIDYNQNQEHISFMTKQYNDMREKYNNSNTEKLVLEHKQEKQEKLLELYKKLVSYYGIDEFFNKFTNIQLKELYKKQIKELEKEK